MDKSLIKYCIFIFIFAVLLPILVLFIERAIIQILQKAVQLILRYCNSLFFFIMAAAEILDFGNYEILFNFF